MVNVEKKLDENIELRVIIELGLGNTMVGL